MNFVPIHPPHKNFAWSLRYYPCIAKQSKFLLEWHAALWASTASHQPRPQHTIEVNLHNARVTDPMYFPRISIQSKYRLISETDTVILLLCPRMMLGSSCPAGFSET
ncbi:hypothetical protein TNCT_186871 [Trichonephila clavata]|uniref:Uncharacterized protein n=1 Tax=Trichonephila clavata TaxID=2740835 RepID=A0A8X6FKJ6_TRICU|nr:hypothetical protein TNCT_186871 [Trichonephila clavata]